MYNCRYQATFLLECVKAGLSDHLDHGSAKMQAKKRMGNYQIIIESVDSICRDSADTQYMQAMLSSLPCFPAFC